jgi:hypothetical protein
VQLNGILDVVDGFLVGFALTVATLESGAGNEETIGVRCDDDGKSNVLLDSGPYRSKAPHGKAPCGPPVCRTRGAKKMPG